MTACGSATCCQSNTSGIGKLAPSLPGNNLVSYSMRPRTKFPFAVNGIPLLGCIQLCRTQAESGKRKSRIYLNRRPSAKGFLLTGYASEAKVVYFATLRARLGQALWAWRELRHVDEWSCVSAPSRT